jgi:hypothetical protein
MFQEQLLFCLELSIFKLWQLQTSPFTKASAMGYPEKMFVQPVDDYWKCPVCADVMQEAVSVYCCDGVFCQECLKTWLVDQKKKTCPQCRRPLTEANAETKDLRTNKYIGTLKTYCSNKEEGCEWTGHLMDMHHHLTNVCPVLMLDCPYKAIGCNKLLRRSELEKHMEEYMASHLKMSMDTITTMKTEMMQLNTLCRDVLQPQLAICKQSVLLEENETLEDSPMNTKVFRFHEQSFLGKDCINSDAFECGGVKWKLQLWPRGDRDIQRNMPSIYMATDFPFNHNTFQFILRANFQFIVQHKDDPTKNIVTDSMQF